MQKRRSEPFGKAPREVVVPPGLLFASLSDGEKAVWGVLTALRWDKGAWQGYAVVIAGNEAGRGGLRSPRRAELAIMGRVTERTVSSAVWTLHGKGMLTTTRQGRENSYRVHLSGYVERAKKQAGEGKNRGSPFPLSGDNRGSKTHEKGKQTTPIGEAIDTNRGSPFPLEPPSISTKREREEEYLRGADPDPLSQFRGEFVRTPDPIGEIIPGALANARERGEEEPPPQEPGDLPLDGAPPGSPDEQAESAARMDPGTASARSRALEAYWRGRN